LRDEALAKTGAGLSMAAAEGRPTKLQKVAGQSKTDQLFYLKDNSVIELCHARASGNPESVLLKKLDARLRGHDSKVFCGEPQRAYSASGPYSWLFFQFMRSRQSG
jgi:hypothetical protein